MTTFAPELAPNIDNTPRSEIHFREGVGIVLGTAAVDSLITVLPIERAEELFAHAVDTADDENITITFSQAQSLAEALRPPEDTSWRNHDLTDEQLFATWDFAKTTQLHGRLREGLRQDMLPLYMRGSARDAAVEAQKRGLYGELSDAAHALAAAAIVYASRFNADEITAVYDAYPAYLMPTREVVIDKDLAPFTTQRVLLDEMAVGLDMSA
jgi:hypothetical protein